MVTDVATLAMKAAGAMGGTAHLNERDAHGNDGNAKDTVANGSEHLQLATDARLLEGKKTFRRHQIPETNLRATRKIFQLEGRSHQNHLCQYWILSHCLDWVGSVARCNNPLSSLHLSHFVAPLKIYSLDLTSTSPIFTSNFFSASLFFCTVWLIPSYTRKSVIAKDEQIHMKGKLRQL